MKLALLAVLAPALLAAQASPPANANWPVYGGTTDNTHYSTLSQITPANVRNLQVAWTYETKDEWKGSEMQANPIVLDGVLYATSPKVRVFALDAATGKELWSFDPNGGMLAQTSPADGLVWLWNTMTGEPRIILIDAADNCTLESVVLHPDGERAVVGGIRPRVVRLHRARRDRGFARRHRRVPRKARATLPRSLGGGP